MDNDSNEYNILNKKRIHEYILMQTSKWREEKEKLFFTVNANQ